MKEFGSDFNYINIVNKGECIFDIYAKSLFFACGRHSLNYLIDNNDWKRIWLPIYYCYETINSIKKTGIEICFYTDYPMFDDNQEIDQIKFKTGDVLLRINYFGLRNLRGSTKVPVPVIEDHSHDLIGEWAQSSNADWCFASLRKTLPTPDGGILWSPKNHKLPQPPAETLEYKKASSQRLLAMKLKTDYLSGKSVSKDYYRSLFIETEKCFENLSVSTLSEESLDILKQIDLSSWYNQKKNNWELLSQIHCNKFKILYPENSNCNVFSLVIQFNDKTSRNIFKGKLIGLAVYPAILWEIPQSVDERAVRFSETMLSIHCDARYSLTDIKELITRINIATDFL